MATALAPPGALPTGERSHQPLGENINKQDLPDVPREGRGSWQETPGGRASVSWATQRRERERAGRSTGRHLRAGEQGGTGAGFDVDPASSLRPRPWSLPRSSSLPLMDASARAVIS